MRWMVILAGCAALLAPGGAMGQSSGVMGNWKTPSGSVVHIDRCGGAVCLWLIYVSRTATAMTDIHNPDPSLRSRSLCGLKIGSGFNLNGPEQATGGMLYDPKTGKTYHGEMALNHSSLQLRGYVGIPLFGQSQTWTRPSTPVEACKGAQPGSQ